MLLFIIIASIKIVVLFLKAFIFKKIFQKPKKKKLKKKVCIIYHRVGSFGLTYAFFSD